MFSGWSRCRIRSHCHRPLTTAKKSVSKAVNNTVDKSANYIIYIYTPNTKGKYLQNLHSPKSRMPQLQRRFLWHRQSGRTSYRRSSRAGIQGETVLRLLSGVNIEDVSLCRIALRTEVSVFFTKITAIRSFGHGLHTYCSA